jgi:diacylglycerol kinase (ATP)
VFRDRRVLVVINPASGRARGSENEGAVREALAKAGARAEIRPTEAAGDARAWAAGAADEGFEFVIAAGGDGTVTAAARGLLDAGARVPLGLVPLGTGNGLARVLEIPMEPARAIEVLAAGRVVALDVMDVLAPEGTALLFLGAGLDADVNKDADPAAKARFGFLAYVWAVLNRLPRLRGHRVTLTLDGVSHTTYAHTVTVFNGGRMEVAGVPVGPDADPHDGRADVAVLRARGYWHALASVARLATREGSRTLFERARELRIEADPPLPVHFDGDVVGTTPLAARVLPGALQVIAAAEYEGGREAEPTD